MMKHEWIAWVADFTVIVGAWMGAKKIYPTVLYVNLTSATLFGIFSYINGIIPLVFLDVVLFSIYTWGLIKHE